MDGMEGSRSLVEPGDTMIQELGACIFHKAITAQCLTLALRSGIGLRAVKYPLPDSMQKHAKFCQICCNRPPKAVLHFDELNEEGCKAFNLPPRIKGEKRCKDESEVKAEDPAETPVKLERRLTGKQSL